MLPFCSSRSRSSTALVGAVTLLVLILLMMIKDLNEKLSVMTASNQNYQRMTDVQVDKIKTLQASLNSEHAEQARQSQRHQTSEAELKQKSEQRQKLLEQQVQTLRRQLQSEQQEHTHVQAEFDRLTQTHVQTSQQLARLEADHQLLLSQYEEKSQRHEHDEAELRAQLMQAGADRDHYKQQYMALYRDHQENVGALQQAHQERQDLAQQLQQRQQQQHESSSSSSSNRSSSNVPQLQEPAAAAQPQKRPSSSTVAASKVVLRPQVAPVEPQVAFHGGISSSQAPVAKAPVAAEPPHHNKAQHQPQHLLHHELTKEDVMEAPRLLPAAVPFQQHQQQPDQSDFSMFLHHPRDGSIEQPLDRPQLHAGNNVHQLQQPPAHQPVYLPQQVRQQSVFGVPHHLQRRQQHGGNNLDRQMDAVHHDHPEQREQLVRGDEKEEDQGEEYGDDAVDGQIKDYHQAPMRYHAAIDHEKGEEDADVDEDAIDYLFPGKVAADQVIQGHGKANHPEIAHNQLKRFRQPPRVVGFNQGHDYDQAQNNFLQQPRHHFL